MNSERKKGEQLNLMSYLALNVKREILAISQKLRWDKKIVMDKIWHGNSSKSEVIGRCAGMREKYE